jgi:hypothetical protein
MRYIALIAGVSTVVVAGCAEPTAPVATTSVRTPGSAAFTNSVEHTKETDPFTVQACNGELVTGDADVHVDIHDQHVQNGNVTITFMSHAKLTGVGDVTGATYRGHQDIKITTSSKTNSDLFENNLSMILTAPGKIQDLHMRIDYTFRVHDGHAERVKLTATSDCH